jgi:predicted SpoU family rRNA methylase
MKYNNETFQQYCKEKRISVIGEYNNIKRETKIEGHCIAEGCTNTFNKSFRFMVEGGAYCKECSIKKGNEKAKEVFLAKYNGHPLKCKEVRDKINKTNLEKYGAENPFQSKQIKEKIKQTNLEKYGVEHPLQNKEVFEKLKKTNMSKYGSENTFQVEEFKEKGKQTNLEKYGVEYAMQNKDVQEGKKQTNLEKYGTVHHMQNTEVMEKMKKNNVEKYGCEYTLQVEEFRDKGIKSNLELYGVENAMQRPEIREKAIQTNLERYGHENTFQVKEFKDKCIATSMLRYGTRHPMQNKEIMSKNTASQYKKKKYTLPSKREIDIQGYEHFALDDLLQSYNEDEIVSGNDNVPELWYETDKTHRHYVDFYIPKENLCIEIKSEWTLKTKKDNIFIKQEAAKEAGYKYEIWVYNKDGKKIKTI